MSGKKNNIISLANISARKVEKEQELEFYRRHLAMAETKLSYIQMDINVTLEIINMIENEKVVLVDDSLPIIEIDDEDSPE
jgi:adenine/guanine phosphoribosyltransferase-like PRPP-binding protein